MKKIILLSLLLLPLELFPQICFTFEDGTLGNWIPNAPGRWEADSEMPLAGNYSLHHCFDNSIESADAVMFSIDGLSLSLSATEWQFTIRYGADPSSSNRWIFLLTSNMGPADVASGLDLSGFAVGVNLEGYDDTLRLWYVDKGKKTVVITSGINWQTDVGTDEQATVKVRRSAEGLWEMSLSSKNTTPLSWTALNTAMPQAFYAGILYNYTSSRDRLLWIDDVTLNGIFIRDTIPPEIVSAVALSPDILEIRMSEEPLPLSLAEELITLADGMSIESVERTDPVTLRLHLNGAMPLRKPDSIIFAMLCDKSGNCTEGASLSFTPVYAIAGDIVISEIMADPSPPVKLPEREYLEITNRSYDSLFIGLWYLIAGADTASVPDCWIRPGEFILLCSSSSFNDLKVFGSTLVVPRFPGLNDSGEAIALQDNQGNLIHFVYFNDGLYNDDLRSGGGWSAELADISSPFNEPDSWHASLDPSGGTPGRTNSVNSPAPDLKCPGVIAVWPLEPDLLKVVFDETIFFTLSRQWVVDGNLSYPSLYADISDRSVLIPLMSDLRQGKSVSVVMPDGISDFSGNIPCSAVLETAIPTAATEGDILFNELLFNPLPSCYDYIEFYNNSDKVIDLSSLYLSAGDSYQARSLTDLPRQLLPGSYVAVTTGRDALLSCYRSAKAESVYQVKEMPSMPDDKGTIVLWDSGMNQIDRVSYSEKMHMVFLSGNEGVSLEKVAPGLSSGIYGYWHSATETSGWGTPGAVNSVVLGEIDVSGGMTLSSTRISPDGDGFEDILSVDLYPGGSDNIITITIMNDRGFAVRRLAVRYSAGTGSRFVWDGLSDEGAPLPSGLYLIIAESYNPAGDYKRWKKVCALLYR